jgi:hypothetical protein
MIVLGQHLSRSTEPAGQELLSPPTVDISTRDPCPSMNGVESGEKKKNEWTGGGGGLFYASGRQGPVSVVSLQHCRKWVSVLGNFLRLSESEGVRSLPSLLLQPGPADRRGVSAPLGPSFPTPRPLPSAPQRSAPGDSPRRPAPGAPPCPPAPPGQPPCLCPQGPHCPLVSRLAPPPLSLAAPSGWGESRPEVRRWQAGSAATCPSAAPLKPASDSATRLSRNAGLGGVWGQGLGVDFRESRPTGENMRN